MKKDIREKVYNETGWHCWYCWTKIEYKQMQVDHIVPQSIKDNATFTTEYKINTIENLLCTCRKCNHYKSALYLSSFREQIKTLHERLKKQYIFQVWLNFWITQINDWNWKFYFEIIWLKKFEYVNDVIEKIKW